MESIEEFQFLKVSKRCLKLEFDQKMTDEALQTLTGLTELDLSQHTRITALGLAPLHQLRRLAMNHVEWSHAELMQLPLALTSLTWSYSQCLCDTSIRRLTNLTHLDLSCSDHIITGEALGSLPFLTSLDMSYCQGYDINFAHLTSVTTLDLTSTETTYRGLAEMPCLTALEIPDNVWMTDSVLAGLTGLRSLSMPMGGVDFNRLTGLTSLCVHGGQREGHVLALDQLVNLEQLTLHHRCRLDVKSARNLTRLTWLKLSQGMCIDEAALASLTGLSTLEVGLRSTISDSSLSRLTNLTHLTLDDCASIADATLGQLQCLTYLQLSDNHHIQGHSLTRLTALRTLDLSGRAAVTNECLGALTGLTDLSLHLNMCITTDTVLLLTALRVLNIYENVLVEPWRLWDALPHCKILS